MNLKRRSEGRVTVVLAYDPIDVRQHVRLDDLRKLDVWTVVAGVSPDGVVLVDGDGARSAFIGAAELRYTDGNRIAFEGRDLGPLETVASSLPPLNVKSIMVALEQSAELPAEESAAKWVSELLIKDREVLSKMLGAPLLSANVWLYYGSPSEYQDIRLTPVDFDGAGLDIQFRSCKDVAIKDTERLLAEIQETYAGAIGKMEQVLDSLTRGA